VDEAIRIQDLPGLWHTRSVDPLRLIHPTCFINPSGSPGLSERLSITLQN
jgi:hypothetical protein